MPAPRVQPVTEVTPIASKPVDALLSSLIALAEIHESLWQQRNDAEARMPSWAAPGLDRIDRDGNRFGHTVGWPERADVRLPNGTGYLFTRISPRKAFEEATFLAPKADDFRPVAVNMRRRYRLNGFNRVRSVIARIREQRVEEAKVGLIVIEREIERVGDEMYDLKVELDDRSTGSTDEAVVLRLVMEVVWEANRKDPLDEQGDMHLPIQLLGRLSYRVDGILQDVARDIGDAGSRTFGELLIGGAGHLATTVLEAIECRPIQAPMTEADPFLALVREYRTQLAAFNAAHGNTTEENDALAAVTMDPSWYRLRDDCPMPTTMEGAIEGIRLLKDELSEGGSGGFELGVLMALVAYFDGRGA